MNCSRRLWIKMLGLAGGLAVCWNAFAEVFPSRTVRIIVPAPAGGVLDIRARFIAERMTKNTGYPVIVENKPGASSMLGADAVAKAPPDGYTILLAGGNVFVTNPFVMQSLSFDPAKDLVPLTQSTSAPFVLVVHPSLAVKSLSDLIALAKSKPNKLNYSSAGMGTFTNIIGEAFKQSANVDIVHVPYKGDAPALTDAVAGHVDMTFGFPLTANEFVKTGRLVALMQTGARRLSLLPNVPTAKEAGFPELSLIPFSGFWAPDRTPSPS